MDCQLLNCTCLKCYYDDDDDNDDVVSSFFGHQNLAANVASERQ